MQYKHELAAFVALLSVGAKAYDKLWRAHMKRQYKRRPRTNPKRSEAARLLKIAGEFRRFTSRAGTHPLGGAYFASKARLQEASHIIHYLPPLP